MFGQNLQERVTNAAPNSTAPDAAGVSSTGEEPPPTAADAVEPGVDAAADGATPEADAAGEAAGGAPPRGAVAGGSGYSVVLTSVRLFWRVCVSCVHPVGLFYQVQENSDRVETDHYE